MSKLQYEDVLDAKRKVDRGDHANDDDGGGDVIDDVAIISGKWKRTNAIAMNGMMMSQPRRLLQTMNNKEEIHRKSF